MVKWGKSLNTVGLWAEGWNSIWTISQQTSNDLLQIQVQEFKTFDDVIKAWYDMYLPGIYYTMKDSDDQLFYLKKDWKIGMLLNDNVYNSLNYKLIIPCEYEYVDHPECNGSDGLKEYEHGKIMFKCKSADKIIKLSYNKNTKEVFQMAD